VLCLEEGGKEDRQQCHRKGEYESPAQPPPLAGVTAEKAHLKVVKELFESHLFTIRL